VFGSDAAPRNRRASKLSEHPGLPTQVGSLLEVNPRRARALVIVLLLLFIANVFDPGGAFGLRYFAFVVALLSTLWTVKLFNLPLRVLTLGLVLFVLWPTWSLLYGAARGGDLFVGIVQVSPFIFAWILALILPALDDRTPLRMFYACLFFFAVAVIASFALIVFLPNSSLSQMLLESLIGLDQREGYFGTRALGDLEVPLIYFRSTLFLVPAFVYYLFVNRLIRAGVILLALGVTLSKAGLTIALVFGAVYSVSALFSRSATGVASGSKTHLRKGLRRFLPAVVVGGVALLILLSLGNFSDEIKDAWAGNSGTAQVRIGHFHSVMSLFLEHPSYLIIGQGVGVPFYSLGESDYVQNFEIDHLNAIRKFGLPWFIGYSAIVFYSARKLIKAGRMEERAFGFALVSIYFAAGTNPVLISGLFVILMTLSYFAQRSCPEFSGVQNSPVASAGGVGSVTFRGSRRVAYGSGIGSDRSA